MQKIGQLQTYVEVKETDDATFLHPIGQEDQSRLIKMRFLSEQPTKLFVEAVNPQTGEFGELRYLTQIEPGLDQIEFYYRGSFVLRLVGGNVWLDTFDNTAFEIESADPDSFARLWEREERDPRILEIERAARHNSMRLEEQMRAERAAFREEMAAIRQEVQKNVTPPSSSSSSSAGSQSAQSSAPASTGDNKSAATAAGPNGGEPQGNA